MQAFRSDTPPSKRKQANPRRKRIEVSVPEEDRSPLDSTASFGSFPLSPLAVSSVSKVPARKLVPAPKYDLDAEWRVSGSRYLFRWVVRSVASEARGWRGNGTTSRQLGFVAGWLSAKESDFTNAKGRPAALYRAVYVGNELDGDTEDLEVHEATATLWSHSCNGCHCFASDKQTLDQHKARCDASHAADAIAAALEAEATLKRKADALARGVSDGATTRGKSRRATPDPDDARPSPPTTPGPDRASPPPPTAENSSSSPQASLLKPPAHPQDAPPLHALFNPPPPPAAAPRAPAPDDEIGSRRPRDDVPGAVARRTLNIAEAYDADTDVEEDARDHRDAGLRRGASPAALVPLPSYEFDLGSGVTVDVGLLRHAGAPHLVLRLGADRLTVYRARRDGAADTASVVATVPFPRPNRSES